jgi:hypothetical protein
MKGFCRWIMIVPVLAMVAGCANFKSAERRDTIPEMGVAAIHVEPLKRSEYRVLGPVTGKCTVTWEPGKGLVDDEGTLVNPSTNKGLMIDPVAVAKDLAQYRALKSMPNADALIAARFRYEYSTERNAGAVVTKLEMTVIGKAIEIIADGK